MIIQLISELQIVDFYREIYLHFPVKEAILLVSLENDSSR